MALLKYISAAGRACAQVWHSFEGDRTSKEHVRQTLDEKAKVGMN